MSVPFTRRNIETVLKDTLCDTPVTIIQGARQVGKSTLATMVSEAMHCISVTLDSELTLAAAKANPYEFVSQFAEGLLIEVQPYGDRLFAAPVSSIWLEK